MPIIYCDNFRGFENTFLELKEVNFFVGENSTGKTSLLKLIGIISSAGFWRYGGFGTDEINFGGFADIITSPRNGKDYFEIAIFNHAEDNKEGSSNAIRLRFIEKDNFPFLKEICYTSNFLNMQAIIEGKYIKFRHNLAESAKEFNLKWFERWVIDNGLNDLAFSRVEVEYKGIIPLLFEFKALVAKEADGNLITNWDKLAGEIDDPSFISPFVWIAPVRAEPQRTYHYQGLNYNSEGKHSFSVLKDILEGPDVKKILNRFGLDSGLYDDIVIQDLSTESADSKTFEILFFINGIARNIVNVGYGISQILPIIIEAIARQDMTWFSTQQPEVHLHPRAQAAFGDFIFKTNTLDRQKFIIETHSDFTIDRFRLRLNKAHTEKLENTSAQIVFFTKSKNGNKLEVIKLNEDGSYPEQQPKEFRSFFIREKLELISI